MSEMNTNNTIPVLTLDPYKSEKPELKVEPSNDLLANLTQEEQAVVKDFVTKIDLTDTNVILNYGADAQNKISDFSETALRNVKTKDLGPVGDMITDLVVQLKGFDATEEQKGFLGLFKKASNKVATLKAKYDAAEVNVDKISSLLEGHQVQLYKDVAMLDGLYDMNHQNFKQLSMYIVAGKMKLQDARNTTLKELQAKAEQSGLPEDVQAANDMAELCNRFEKKLHDLEITRVISIQMAPQIRMVQNSDILMAEKIQTTLVNTLPLWKSQMVLALGMAHTEQAMKAQREVTNLTNELLKKNAEMLKTATVETAKESERAIVDIETLTYTNQMLISTLDEVMQVEKDGREKRIAAQNELNRIEGELKNKMLEMSKK